MCVECGVSTQNPTEYKRRMLCPTCLSKAFISDGHTWPARDGPLTNDLKTLKKAQMIKDMIDTSKRLGTYGRMHRTEELEMQRLIGRKAWRDLHVRIQGDQSFFRWLKKSDD